MEAMRFEGKVILITGSSRGIGRDTALRFAREAGTVIVHGHADSDRLDDAFSQVKELRPDSAKLTCELSDSGSIRR